MKIILLKDIPKIGKKNDVKEIADGYATNYILPKKFGIRATENAIIKLEQEKKKWEQEKNIQKHLLRESLKQLDNFTIKIKEKANEDGHLFVGIHKEKIVEEIEKQINFKLNSKNIILEKPIKELGNFLIEIKTDLGDGKLKLVVEEK